VSLGYAQYIGGLTLQPKLVFKNISYVMTHVNMVQVDLSEINNNIKAYNYNYNII